MKSINTTLLAAGLLAASLTIAGQVAAADVFDEMLDVCLKDKKGVVIHTNGQAISGRVIKVSAETVEISSREYPRIVIRRDRIDAMAHN